jgi:hypothetical protein
VALSPWDSPVVEVGWWRALQPEDEANRDRGCHQAAHHCPDNDHMQRLADEPEQKETQRPLRDRHPDDGKGLSNGFKEDRADGVACIGHVLSKAVLRRYSDGGRVA